MTVTAISPRATQSPGHPRPALSRRRPATPPEAPPQRERDTLAALTVTVDISLGAGGTSPEATQLLEMVRDLVERGGGTVTVAPHPQDRPAGALPPRPVTGADDADPTVGAGPEPADDDPEVLRVFASSRVVTRAGAEVPLTRLEFDLLLFLAEHPRRVFTRLQLLNSVWGYDHAVARTVDVHVRRLRAKIGERVPLVTTVYGVGYRLADEARVHIRHGA
ncbi:MULTISPECIES: winged helix-turn-helix domain-containing protein [Polymorphospora]|uniref:Winged helix-turn-helix domain-containing protein n=1 Tax=Polymorphospora lycopeni TaxID=3140240 RepID=A0ABV5CMK2_9ACTN